MLRLQPSGPRPRTLTYPARQDLATQATPFKPAVSPPSNFDYSAQSFTPLHYKLDQGPMEVSYGFDGPSVQYFLAVADTRLRWHADAPRESNQVCRALCPGGDGGYLTLHTGPNGTGRRVSADTLADFWERYGVPEDHVAALRQGLKKF